LSQVFGTAQALPHNMGGSDDRCGEREFVCYLCTFLGPVGWVKMCWAPDISRPEFVWTPTVCLHPRANRKRSIDALTLSPHLVAFTNYRSNHDQETNISVVDDDSKKNHASVQGVRDRTGVRTLSHPFFPQLPSFNSRSPSQPHRTPFHCPSRHIRQLFWRLPPPSSQRRSFHPFFKPQSVPTRSRPASAKPAGNNVFSLGASTPQMRVGSSGLMPKGEHSPPIAFL